MGNCACSKPWKHSDSSVVGAYYFDENECLCGSKQHLQARERAQSQGMAGRQESHRRTALRMRRIGGGIRHPWMLLWIPSLKPSSRSTSLGVRASMPKSNPWDTSSIASPGANDNTTDKAPAKSTFWSFASRKPLVTKTRRGRDSRDRCNHPTLTIGYCSAVKPVLCVVPLANHPILYYDNNGWVFCVSFSVDLDLDSLRQLFYYLAPSHAFTSSPLLVKSGGTYKPAFTMFALLSLSKST